jgi:hypothetical protein
MLEAVRFYETRLSGLGEQFLNEFERAIARIEATPEAWQKVEDDLILIVKLILGETGK